MLPELPLFLLVSRTGGLPGGDGSPRPAEESAHLSPSSNVDLGSSVPVIGGGIPWGAASTQHLKGTQQIQPPWVYGREACSGERQAVGNQRERPNKASIPARRRSRQGGGAGRTPVPYFREES